MIAFAELQECIGHVKRATSMVSLRDSMAELTRTLGFSYYGLAHHTDLNSKRRDVVALTSYPTAWITELLEQKAYSHDPIMIVSERTPRSFRWSELPEILRMTDKQNLYMTRARRAGLRDGLTVPINLPGSLPGSCSFVVNEGIDFPYEALPHAHYAGCFAFEAARRLVEERAGGDLPRLSTRQLDCIVLASQGKSDSAIAQLLGISPDTAHQHVEAAKRRLGVATRQQLVARALFDGYLSYADVLH